MHYHTYFIHQTWFREDFKNKKSSGIFYYGSSTPPSPNPLLAKNDLVTSCNIVWLDSPPLSLRMKQRFSTCTCSSLPRQFPMKIFSTNILLSITSIMQGIIAKALLIGHIYCQTQPQLGWDWQFPICDFQPPPPSETPPHSSAWNSTT